MNEIISCAMGEYMLVDAGISGVVGCRHSLLEGVGPHRPKVREKVTEFISHEWVCRPRVRVTSQRELGLPGEVVCR